MDDIKGMLKGDANNVTLEMAKALMGAHETGDDFKRLAEAHIIPNLEEVLATSDPLTQTVYEELFKATNTHIKEFFPPLLTAFALMNEQTKNDKSAGLFLGSFVLNKTRDIVQSYNK